MPDVFKIFEQSPHLEVCTLNFKQTTFVCAWHVLFMLADVLCVSFMFSLCPLRHVFSTCLACFYRMASAFLQVLIPTISLVVGNSRRKNGKHMPGICKLCAGSTSHIVENK